MPPLYVFHFADRPFLCFPLWSSGVLKGSKHKLLDGLSDVVLEKTGANLLGADNGVWQKWVDAGLEGKTKSTGEVFAEGDRVKVFSVTRLSNPSAGTFTPEFGDTSSTDQGDASLVAEEVA